MSSAALTVLATCKAWLKITTSTGDSLISSLIAGVSAAASIYCNRNFGSASYTEIYSGEGTRTLFLKNRPCTAVTSMTLNGLAVPARPSVNANGYAFDANNLFYDWGFTTGFQNVTVVYTAGFAVNATATPDIWEAATEWVGELYKQSERIGKKSDTLGTQTTSYINDIPHQTKRVFDMYRNVALQGTV